MRFEKAEETEGVRPQRRVSARMRSCAQEGAVGAGGTVLTGEVMEDAIGRPGILKWKIGGTCTGKSRGQLQRERARLGVTHSNDGGGNGS